MQKHWREPAYWVWLWHHRAPVEAKVAIGALVLIGVLGSGWLAADRLTSAHATVAGTKPYVFQTTVKKLVTVREKGRIVLKQVPVVKTVRVIPRRETRTVYRTAVRYKNRVVNRVVNAPGQVHTRTVRAVVPVVRKRVVTVNGTPRTLVTTEVVPTTVTDVRTQTVTTIQSVAQPASTVTTSRTVTVTQTQTQTQTQTVTGPLVTITVTTTVKE